MIDESNSMEDKIRALAAMRVKPAEIARRLNVSRQAVHYHLGFDKRSRSRGAMSEERRDDERRKRRANYHLKKLDFMS